MITTRQALFAWMQAQLNIPYVWGGDDPAGYDCSGIAQEFYAAIGVDPPGDQTAHDYWQFFAKEPNGRVIRKTEGTQFGDMVFYGKPTQVIHIAVAVNGLLCFEEGGGGRKPDPTAFARFRPILHRKDLIAIVRIPFFEELQE